LNIDSSYQSFAPPTSKDQEAIRKILAESKAEEEEGRRLLEK
jgi:hypothetical protein